MPWGPGVQQKVFRIEQMLTGKRTAAPGAGAEQRQAVDELKMLHAKAERREVPDAAHALKHELELIQNTIAQHKRDLAALIGDDKQRRIARASGELGAAVDGMEKGAEKVLKSAESIDDSARALCATLNTEYERGLAQDIQDHIVRIYEACNFQDLAGQRIGKVIATLNSVEDRLSLMLARCDGASVSPAAAEPARGNGLLNGPRLDGDAGHASQRDIDAMFVRR
jgi:chemotaxis protein CheZ